MLSLNHLLIWKILFKMLIYPLCWCSNSSSSHTNTDIGHRIVGGKNCDIEEFPFLVSIHKRFHHCGGSLINHLWILTAGHCCNHKYQSESMNAYIGLTNQDYLGKAEKIPIKSQIIHPKYGAKSLANDVCLMKLSHAVQQSDTIKFVKIARPEPKGWLHHICSYGTIMGWGSQTVQDFRYTSTKPSKTRWDPHLKCAELEVPDYIYCIDRGTSTHGGKKFCAHADGVQDICKGDSGGPFLCNDTLYGIVSSGRACGVKGLPGSFVRIQFYDDFISDALEGKTFGSTSCLFLSSILKLIPYVLFLINIITNTLILR